MCRIFGLFRLIYSQLNGIEVKVLSIDKLIPKGNYFCFLRATDKNSLISFVSVKTFLTV